LLEACLATTDANLEGKLQEVEIVAFAVDIECNPPSSASKPAA
jgi:hypothetical protein